MRRVNDFLKQCRILLSEQAPTPSQLLHCVLGNESADLDSVVCAIVYGYHRTLLSKVTHVPVVNIPRKDFPLRKDITYLFHELGLENDQLIFLDEIDFPLLHREKKLSLTLVDHNVLNTTQGFLGDCVEQIIDHHRDESLYPQAKLKIVEVSGSCASLVFRQILKENVWNLEKEEAKLILAPILVDSINLEEKYQRTFPVDREMAAKLLSILSPSPEEANKFQHNFFEKLQFAKFDISLLPTDELFRKDYKEWTIPATNIQLGISSVTMSVDEIIGRSDFYQSSAEYAKNLGIWMCMTICMKEGGNQTDLHRGLIVSFPGEIDQGLLKFLEGNESALRLEKKSCHQRNYFLYEQGNNTISRKNLVPKIMDYYAGLK